MTTNAPFSALRICVYHPPQRHPDLRRHQLRHDQHGRGQDRGGDHAPHQGDAQPEGDRRRLAAARCPLQAPQGWARWAIARRSASTRTSAFARAKAGCSVQPPRLPVVPVALELPLPIVRLDLVLHREDDAGRLQRDVEAAAPEGQLGRDSPRHLVDGGREAFLLGVARVLEPPEEEASRLHSGRPLGTAVFLGSLAEVERIRPCIPLS